jgi:hypothetical protein
LRITRSPSSTNSRTRSIAGPGLLSAIDWPSKVPVVLGLRKKLGMAHMRVLASDHKYLRLCDLCKELVFGKQCADW